MIGCPRLLLVSLAVVAVWGAVPHPSGPYDVLLEKLEKCEDPGTDESAFPTRLNKVNSGKAVINDVIRISPAIDQDSRMDIELQEWGNQGYRPRAFQFSFKTCNKIWKETGGMLHDILLTAGANITGCPIPAGNYSAQNLVLDLHPSRIPVMTYSRFRVIVNIWHGNRRVGCSRLYVETVPKEAKR